MEGGESDAPMYSSAAVLPVHPLAEATMHSRRFRSQVQSAAVIILYFPSRMILTSDVFTGSRHTKLVEMMAEEG